MKHCVILVANLLVSVSLFAQYGTLSPTELALMESKETPAEALALSDSLIHVDSLQARYYLLKASILLEEGRYVYAIETLSLGIIRLPDSAVLYDARGNELEELRRFRPALQDFDKALRLGRGTKWRVHVLANRGGLKARMRDFDGAYEDLMEAVGLDSMHFGTLNNLASVCDEVGKPEETLIYLGRVLEIDPDFLPALINSGFALQKQDRHEEALAFFGRALELQPDEPLAYSNRSFSRLKMGDLDGAMQDINRSLELFPTNSYAYRTRAMIYLEQKDASKACRDLTRAVELGFTQEYGPEVEELQVVHCEE